VGHDRWLDNLRAARTDPVALARLLFDELPADGLQHAGDAVLCASAAGPEPVLETIASAVIVALRERGWVGDRELADAIEHTAGRGTSQLAPLIVELDELADALSEAEGSEGFLDLRTGEVWTETVIEAIHNADDFDVAVADQRIAVYGAGSREPYRDMEQFIATIDDPDLAGRLRDAIDGRGAFRRFPAVLEHAPEEFTRWHRYRDEARLGRARAWLAEHGYQAQPRHYTAPPLA
jgi:hypothetical protein